MSRVSKDIELETMGRVVEAFAKLSTSQRRRVLSWLSQRMPELPEPRVLPGQLVMFPATPEIAAKVADIQSSDPSVVEKMPDVTP